MKRFHGLARARGYGLRSVSLQAKFTAVAVNLKRIAKMVSSLNRNKPLKKQLLNEKKEFKTVLGRGMIIQREKAA